MFRLLIRLALFSLAFTTVLPLINGIDFHGNWGAALGLSIFFAVMLWLVDLVAIMISAVLTVTTFGLALLWIIPFWILGFWLLPAVALRLVADFVPEFLTVQGWMPAILGGLVMMFVSLVTSDPLWEERQA